MTLSYPKVDDAVVLVRSAGQCALMAKLDVKAAYRHVPVHPDDQSLLALRWVGAACIDTALPFGLFYAPSYLLLWRMPWSGA